MLPDFVVIGAMKCATTSLHDYLGLHPDIGMSPHLRSPARVHGETSPAYTNHPDRPGAVERMHSVIPEARLAYCVRDPVRRAVSHYLHDWARGFVGTTAARFADVRRCGPRVSGGGARAGLMD